MEHHFFAYMSRMRFIHRWGLMRNTLPENDLEHAAQTAMMAHAIAVIGVRRHGRTYDPQYIMALAMYHDASEVITGDMPTPVKHNNPIIKEEYRKLEEAAEKRLLSMLPEDLQHRRCLYRQRRKQCFVCSHATTQPRGILPRRADIVGLDTTLRVCRALPQW